MPNCSVARSLAVNPNYALSMSLPQPGPDRAAVVTGASSGIGIELARELSRRGHQVVLVARSADKLQALADELGNAHAVPCDLTSRESRAGLLDKITALGVEPDILINNAGFSTLGPVHAADPAGELNLVEVDIASVVDLTTRFLPGMVSRGRGALLNVASTAAFQPLPGQAAYAAAKSFVLSYTQSVRGELKGTGRHRHRAVPRSGRHRVRRGCGLHGRAGRERAAQVPLGVGRGRRACRDRRAGQGLDGGRPGRREPDRFDVRADHAAQPARPDPRAQPPRPEVAHALPKLSARARRIRRARADNSQDQPANTCGSIPSGAAPAAAARRANSRRPASWRSPSEKSSVRK